MKNTILNVKTDPETKQAVKEFAESIGMTVSGLMNAQLKQLLRDRKVVLSTELEPTPYLEKIMADTEEDLKTGRNTSRPMNKEELARHLSNL